VRIDTEAVKLPKTELRLAALKEAFSSMQHPVRFVITGKGVDSYFCELDCVSDIADYELPKTSIFDYSLRCFDNTEKFNVVLIIPTGIAAQIGGHCGDANAVARLLASACDTLITHPNVVNAADMNEMTENTLYVEGSILTRFLMGTIGLQKVRSNRVLILMDSHPDKAFNNAAVNVVSTARVCLGIDCDLLQMADMTTFKSRYSKAGRASGEITQVENLFEIIAAHRCQYDAIGLTTRIEVPLELELEYYKNSDTVNPWGGIEAMLTHSIACAFDIPCAHSPMALTLTGTNMLFETMGIVDPRKAADICSRTYLYSIVKGLYKAPRIVYGAGLTVEDVSCLVIPDGCIGLPTLAAMEQGIPVIAVKENRTLMQNRLEDLPFKPGKLFVVDNYWEAVGVMTALKAGVAPAAVRRPLSDTKLLKQC
jgi:hypothetical protein